MSVVFHDNWRQERIPFEMQGRESLQKVIGSLKDKKFKCKINIRSSGPKDIEAELRANGNS